MACEYTRELSWGGRPFNKSRFGKCIDKDQGLVVVQSESVDSPGLSRTKSRGRMRNLDRQFVYTWMPMFDASVRPVETGSPVRRSGTRDQHLEPFEHPDMYSCPSIDWEDEVVPSPATSMPRDTLETIESFQDTPEDAGSIYSEAGDDDSSIPDWLTSPRTLVPALVPSSHLSSLSPRNRSLLDYFQHDVCLALSCHDGIQRDLCSALIPMAQDSPHLSAAMLCAAASRRYATGQDQTLDQVILLRSNAIRLLGNAINGHSIDVSPARGHVDSLLVALATSLVLCISEIVSSENTAGGWRVYLSGASALMERLRETPCSQAGFSINFVKRLYTSLKAVSVGCGLRVGQLHTVKPPDQYHGDNNIDGDEGDYIDDFVGFSTSLIPIFEKIHSMNRSEVTETGDEHLELTPASLLSPDWRQGLIESVQLMLIRRKPRFRPGVASSLSLGAKTDFWLLDEAYHHMALVCLYEQQLKESMLWYEPFKQASIDRIIACIGAMDIARKPSPGAAILPPLFTAGCAATEEGDIVRILALLRLSKGSFGMGNVMLTQRVLEARWEMVKEGGGSSLGQRDEGLDFLPY